ncbi:unnamed protein product [Laminaria digitata]
MMVSRWVMLGRGKGLGSDRRLVGRYRRPLAPPIGEHVSLGVARLVEGRQDSLWFGEGQATSMCQPPRGLPTFTWDTEEPRAVVLLCVVCSWTEMSSTPAQSFFVSLRFLLVGVTHTAVVAFSDA